MAISIKTTTYFLSFTLSGWISLQVTTKASQHVQWSNNIQNLQSYQIDWRQIVDKLNDTYKALLVTAAVIWLYVSFSRHYHLKLAAWSYSYWYELLSRKKRKVTQASSGSLMLCMAWTHIILLVTVPCIDLSLWSLMWSVLIHEISTLILHDLWAVFFSCEKGEIQTPHQSMM